MLGRGVGDGEAQDAENGRASARRASAADEPHRRAVEAALAGVVHDIRTPLTGIVALAELLAASDLGARERAWAAAIKSGADHLAALTTLIVDAVKADAAGPDLAARAVLAAAAGRGGRRRARRARRQQGHQDRNRASPSDLPAMVAGDALRLRAALENLADNAVKFTGEGAVTFTAGAKAARRANACSSIFTVADTGIGIDARDIEKSVPPVRAGERSGRAPLRRRRPRARLRQARRRGHGRRSAA